MNFEQFKARYTNFVDRYFPDFSNVNNAISALRVIDRDPLITVVEKAALAEYIGSNNAANHTPIPNIDYVLCTECDFMVGIADHIHCPTCTYPVVKNNGGGLVEGASPVIMPCGDCADCCKTKNCVSCPDCNKHFLQLCRYCHKCNPQRGDVAQCCVCIICASCGSLTECDDCGYCYECCNCPTVRTNGAYGKIWTANKHSERKLFNCQRTAGVEWEFNRVNTRKYLKQWVKKWFGEIHHDGSCGEEAVTPPIAGDYIVQCISALGEAFKQSGATADDRCSIHVHVDAKDLYWSDIFRLLKLYAKLEPILYLLGGQERLKNTRYCLPCGVAYTKAMARIDRKDAVLAFALNPNAPNIDRVGRIEQKRLPGKKADGRYRGLNLCPWLAGRLKKVGNKKIIAPDTTLEFRIHKNTLDTNSVVNWTKMIVRIVDWVAKSTDTDLDKLPKSPLRILCKVIAPECTPWILHKVKEWRKETARSRGGNLRKIKLINGIYKY